MRKLLAVLLVCITTVVVHAAGALDIINEYRTWVEANNSTPGGLSRARLLADAGEYLSYNVQEPAQLAVIEATELPEAKAHVANVRAKTVDQRMALRRAAMQALAELSERELGEEDIVSLTNRFHYIDLESSFRNVSREAEALSIRIRKALKKHYSKPLHALAITVDLCLCRYPAFGLGIDLPDYYPRIFELEAEALKLFPVADVADKSLDKANLYAVLGQVKGDMYQTMFFNFAFDDADTANGTFYNRIANGTYSNANWYFGEAEQIYSSLYPDLYPLRFNNNYNRLKWTTQNYLCGPEEMASSLLVKNIAEYYYPEGSFEQAFFRLSHWLNQLQYGEPPADLFLAGATAKALRQALGDDNPGLPDYESALVIIAQAGGAIMADRLLEEFNAHVDNLCTDAPLLKAQNLHFTYGTLKDLKPALAQRYMPQALSLYLDNHSPTAFSTVLGWRLLLDYANGLHNYDGASQIVDALIQDLDSRYGRKEHYGQLYWKARLFKLQLMQQKQPHEAERQYPLILKEMGKKYPLYYATLFDYANYCTYTLNNYVVAEPMWRELLSDPTATDVEKTSLLMGYLMSLDLANRPDEAAKIYSQVEPALLNPVDTLTIEPSNYLFASQHLEQAGRFDDALTMVEKGLDFLALITGSDTDPQSIQLHKQKANLLFNRLNRRSQAQQYMNKVYAAIEPQSRALVDTSVLDFLWTWYWQVKNNNPGDMVGIGDALNRIMTITQRFQENGATDSAFLCDYAVPLLTESLSLYGYYMRMMSKEDMERMEREHPEQYRQTMLQWESCVDTTKDILSRYSEYDPNFNTSVNYANLVWALATFMQTRNAEDSEVEQYLLEYQRLAQNIPYILPSACQSLMWYYMGQNNVDKAQRYYHETEAALNATERQNPDWQLELANMANTLAWARDDHETMISSARRHYQLLRSVMDNNFPMMTEAEQNNFMEKYTMPAGRLQALLERFPERLGGEIYDATLYTTGMQLRSQRKVKEAILRSDNAALKAMVDSLAVLQNRANAIVVAYNGAQDTMATRNMLMKADLQRQINLLETEILEEAAQYRDTTNINVRWTDVQRALPRDGASVEFVYSQSRFMALVLRPGDKAPRVVPLTPIDSLIHLLRPGGRTLTSRALARKLYSLKSPAPLYRMLWQPLEKELQGVTDVYFTAPGLLSTLSFAAFAVEGQPGEYLIDKYRLHQLTSTAQLVAQSRQRGRGALVMGDIYYSERQKQADYRAHAAANRGEDDSIFDFDDNAAAENADRGLRPDHFAFLPNTALEIDTLHTHLAHHGMAAEEVALVRHDMATEQEFRRRVASQPGLLHLATHGFFIATPQAAAKVPFYSRYAGNLGSSMRRAGIALAGAEATWTGRLEDEDSDGILTADEVSRLDLFNTELATLSACETALGDFTFEGVLGLPRGFKQAGVESLLVSLWSVDDRSSALLMNEFYSRWLGGQSKSDAWRGAMKALRGQYPDPYYWGPFMLLDAK